MILVDVPSKAEKVVDVFGLIELDLDIFMSLYLGMGFVVGLVVAWLVARAHLADGQERDDAAILASLTWAIMIMAWPIAVAIGIFVGIGYLIASMCPRSGR